MKTTAICTTAISLLAFTALLQDDLQSAELQWHQWRGGLGTGHATVKDVPTRWTDDDVLWRTVLPGSGQSSPVAWGNRIFLTSAENDGRQRLVFCLDADKGTLLWKQVAWIGDPEKTHSMNNRASSTCATDGERVIAFFGRGGLHCFDVSGKKMWSLDLGPFAGPWGTGASPIIVGDLVIQNCDAENDSFLLAVNKTTGEQVWRTPRPAARGWSTPLLVKHKGQSYLALNGEHGVTAYATNTGEQLWTAAKSQGRGTPTVTSAQGLLISVCGRRGDIVALRIADGTEAWRVPRKTGRDLPSPIVVGDYLFVTNLRPGTGTCYDLKTGHPLWSERLASGASASPIAVNGMVYALSENGEVDVIALGSEFKHLASNRVAAADAETFRASPMPAKGRLYLRSNQALYCIGKKEN